VTEEARSALIEMARVWTRLADEQNLPPNRLSESAQPVMQQQQQIQPKNYRGQPVI
jgi:hypothetical protein